MRVQEVCGEVVPGEDSERYAEHGGLACLRRKGHEGEHVAMACEAQAADEASDLRSTKE